jgi:integrase
LIAADLGMPETTLHGLRHTHASQLVEAGVDIVTTSKRLGHASPDVTLRGYAHMFRRDDGSRGSDQRRLGRLGRIVIVGAGFGCHSGANQVAVN